jgi:phosphoribosylformimino-5-aminoimidazole carboxamide ribotide isomerase
MDDPAVASDFELYPAIDLLGGRVVRLERGDFATDTTFSTDPAGVAASFAAQGARWLHVVDLDGARTGTPAHGDTVAAIVTAVGPGTSVEVAGGLRTMPAVGAALAAGAARVVMGTAALGATDVVDMVIATHGTARLAVALDVRAGIAVGEGWREGASGQPAEDALHRLADHGVSTFEVTSIDRDGLLGGPDLALYERLIGLGRGAVIASGGIRSSADVRAVRDVGCAGAIVGRALYAGRISITDVLVSDPRGPSPRPLSGDRR